jgi:hypothetical protein
MWYLLKIYALITVSVFGTAGLLILLLFLWNEATALATGRYRIYERLTTLTTEPRFLANPLAKSRAFAKWPGR